MSKDKQHDAKSRKPGRPPTGQARRQVLQVLLTEEEQTLIRAAAERKLTSVSQQARDILLGWARSTLNVASRCADCDAPEAYYHHVLRKVFLCVDCAALADTKTPGICTADASAVDGFVKQQRAFEAQVEARLDRKYERKFAERYEKLITEMNTVLHANGYAAWAAPMTPTIEPPVADTSSPEDEDAEPVENS